MVEHGTGAAPRVVSLGDNCLDVYVHQDAVFTGGSALNVAAGWHGLGLNASYHGAVGEDRAASLLLDGLRAAGLDVGSVDVLPGATAVTLVELVGSERHFAFEDFGVGLDWDPPDLLERTEGAAWCHVTGTAPRAGIPSRLVRAGRRVSVDLLATPGEDHGDLSGIEVAFVSCDGTEDDAVAAGRAVVAEGAPTAVVMRGASGSLAVQGDDVVQAQAEAIRPVDTCGAGDAFVAGFTAAVLDRASLDACLRAGTRTATAACLHRGGFPQEARPIPDWLKGLS